MSFFRHIRHIICFLLISHSAIGQTSIKGRVVNQATGEPLTGASVYFNNTSIGTTTNATGEFSIAFPAIANPELIVSSVGFDIVTYRIKAGEDLSRHQLIKLTTKQALLQDILVLPDATRRRYLKIFTDNFVGVTQEAATSTLKNIDAIYFTKKPGEKSGLYAYADTPLVIVNKMLGYRVYFQLQEFYYNEATGGSSFYGYTRYEEMGDKKRWIKNRRKAYYGSTMHFFRSLISHKLKENAFKIYFVRTDTIIKNDGTRSVMDMAIPTSDSLIVRKDTSEENLYRAYWKNKLMVQYFKEPASKAWLRQYTFMNGGLPIGFRSYLIFKEDENFIEIDNNGILHNPMSIAFSGYWIYEKAANLLPYDYDPNTN